MTGRARGVEALARWTHPSAARSPPDVFIPLAEQIGLIVPLGRQLFTRACNALPALRAGLGEPELLMAVNLSAAQLLDPALPDDLRRSVAEAGITTGSLMLEITEGQLITDLDAGVARLHELKALGVYLALDDFGTGYSSLAYLRSFPVDSLKVDQAFIDNVADTGLRRPRARPLDHLARPDARGPRRRRGDREPGAAGRARAPRLRPRPGLPVRAADARRRSRRDVRAVSPTYS